jgi:cold shock CspA family protein
MSDRLRRQVFEPGTGVVSAFDEPRGLGTVTSGSGEELLFHCTAIADGTRTISVGERVRFQVVPGRLGRWEATHIETG